MTNISDAPNLQQHTLEDTLNIISGSVGALSTMGCIVNIALTYYFRKSKITIGKMILILAIFDILNHVPWILFAFASVTPVSCQILSWISYFGFTSSIFFTTCFAHALSQSVRGGSIDHVEKYTKRYIAVAIIAGLIAGTLAVGIEFREYDEDSSICITRPVDGFNWGSLLLLIIPGTASIVGCTYFYFLTIKMLRSLARRQHWELLVYPMILVICLSPTLLRRFLDLFGYEIFTSPPMRVVIRGLFGAQGFLNSLAYGLSREICNAIKKTCCRTKRSESLMDSVSSSVDDPHSFQKRNTVNYL